MNALLLLHALVHSLVLKVHLKDLPYVLTCQTIFHRPVSLDRWWVLAALQSLVRDLVCVRIYALPDPGRALSVSFDRVVALGCRLGCRLALKLGAFLDIARDLRRRDKSLWRLRLWNWLWYQPSL